MYFYRIKSRYLKGDRHHYRRYYQFPVHRFVGMDEDTKDYAEYAGPQPQNMGNI